MTGRTGSADLPLHGGSVPRWLAARMERLGRVVVEAIVLEFGREEVLRRLAHPFWFQSLGAVMGMDWHSSGTTTSTLAALKRGLAPVADEIGLYVCGGRGKRSRRTPEELAAVGERTGVDGATLARTSRLVAKVDSAAVQDGFALYLHGFIVDVQGNWAVVQQGMDATRHEARRYHWMSEGLRDFLDSPHTAIEGRERGTIINLADRRARDSRQQQLTLIERGPDVVVDALLRHATAGAAALATEPVQAGLPHLSMPAHHDVRPADVRMRRLWGSSNAATNRMAPASVNKAVGRPIAVRPPWFGSPVRMGSTPS